MRENNLKRPWKVCVRWKFFNSRNIERRPVPFKAKRREWGSNESHDLVMGLVTCRSTGATQQSVRVVLRPGEAGGSGVEARHRKLRSHPQLYHTVQHYLRTRYLVSPSRHCFCSTLIQENRHFMATVFLSSLFEHRWTGKPNSPSFWQLHPALQSFDKFERPERLLELQRKGLSDVINTPHDRILWLFLQNSAPWHWWHPPTQKRSKWFEEQNFFAHPRNTKLESFLQKPQLNLLSAGMMLLSMWAQVKGVKKYSSLRTATTHSESWPGTR